MNESFGKLILKARKDKGYSQRALAQLLNLDFTYLSKLENDRAEYAPKEEAIRVMARHLDLDAEELIFLAGRFPKQDEQFLKEHYKDMPVLLRRMRENPDFAQQVFKAATQAALEEPKT